MQNRVVVIVQCRVQSTRLPGKALLPIVDDMSIVEFLLRRLKTLKNADDLILTTGTGEANDPLEDIARSLEVKCSRGSEEDVLERFLTAADETGAQTIVRVCADNPLTDPQLIDELIALYEADDTIDHLATFAEPSVPYGVGCAIFSKEVLSIARDFPKDDASREHIEPFMLESKDVHTHHYVGDVDRHMPNLKVTVDSQRDYDYVQPIVSVLYRRHGLNFTTQDLISLVTRPRFALFANGELGLRGARFFKEKGIDIAALVLHPEETSRNRQEILSVVGLPDERVIDYTDIKRHGNEWFEKRQADICVSLWSSYIFKQSLIQQFPLGVYNLHNSLLPELGGCGANIWTCLLDKKKSGVTLHRISPEIDRGPIIDQRSLSVSMEDTGGSVFEKQHTLMMQVLAERWEDLPLGNYDYVLEDTVPSYYSAAKRDEYKKIDLEQKLSAKELINIIRAYHFGDEDAAYFEDEEGQSWDVRISIGRRGKTE